MAQESESGNTHLGSPSLSSHQESFEVHLRGEKRKPPIAKILRYRVLDFVSFLLLRDSARDSKTWEKQNAWQVLWHLGGS